MGHRASALLCLILYSSSAASDELNVEFASQAQGAAILTQRDDFVQRMSDFDRMGRMKDNFQVTEAAYLNFVAANVQAWSDAERAVAQSALDDVLPKVRALSLPWPKVIYLVRTSGAEEGNAAYTRGNAIVFPRSMVAEDAKPPRRLVAHELFHVLTRTNPALKERLYAAIGFFPCGEVPTPTSLRSRRVTNPDAPLIEHCIRLSVDGRSTWAMPILYARESYKGGNFFDYLTFEFLLVETDRMRARYDVDAPELVQPAKAGGFFEQIGRNTEYIIHPEEILADNFAMLLLDEVPKSPEILEKLRSELVRGATE